MGLSQRIYTALDIATPPMPKRHRTRNDPQYNPRQGTVASCLPNHRTSVPSGPAASDAAVMASSVARLCTGAFFSPKLCNRSPIR